MTRQPFVPAALGLLLAMSMVGSVEPATELVRGTVTRVVDGDTLWFQPDDRQRPLVAVRLRGIDAPESCQRWGPQATAALRDDVEGQAAVLRTHGMDDYRRTVGTLRRDGVDINRRLVERGLAWAWRDPRGRGPYVRDEREARERRQGLFADPEAVSPAEFRASHGRCRR